MESEPKRDEPGAQPAGQDTVSGAEQPSETVAAAHEAPNSPAPQQIPAPVDGSQSHPAPVQVHVDPAVPQPVEPQHPSSVDVPAAAAPSVPPQDHPQAAPPQSPTDPIAEAPELVWYVRPPTGGEFGPAKGDIMQRWIDEGRVTPDSLVWRQGWPEWQPANQAIPSLNR